MTVREPNKEPEIYCCDNFRIYREGHIILRFFDIFEEPVYNIVDGNDNSVIDYILYCPFCGVKLE